MTQFGTVRVPETSVVVTRLGFGCSRLFAGAELSASARIVEAALSAGIRHFDTAPTYGAGGSESVLGEVLAGIEGVTVATKFGRVPPSTAPALPSGASSLYRRSVRPILARVPALKAALMSVQERKQAATKLPARALRTVGRQEVEASLDQSLKRLKRDKIDIFLVHEPDSVVLDEAVLAFLLEAQRDGVIGAFGLAYGRVVHEDPSPFGQIVQSTWDPIASPRTAEGFLCIYHGVLRSRREKGRAVERLVNALIRSPDAAVLFSASAPFQIKQATATF